MFDIEALLLLVRGLGKRAENRLRELLAAEAEERRAADAELWERLGAPGGADIAIATKEEVEAMLTEVFSN